MPATYSKSQEFGSLPLHDAILGELRFDWKKATCVVVLDVFIDRTRNAVPCHVTWHGVVEAHIPHHSPWGPSVFLHSARYEAPNLYIIEMQSGDEIRIFADGFEFITSKA